MKSLSDDADSNDESEPQQQQHQQHQQQHRPTEPSSSTASAAPGGILRLTAGEAELEAFSDTVRHLWCSQQQQQQQQPPRGATRRTASDGNDDDDDAGSSSQRSRNGIPILPEPPTALRFSRDFVGPNRPCIIRNAILVNPPSIGDGHDDGPGRVRQRADGGGDNNAGFVEEGDHCVVPLYLDLDQICNHLPVHETMLTVDVTPDGHGDCVRTAVAAAAVAASASASAYHEASSSSSSGPCQVFARPKESRMSLFEFRRRLRKQDGTQHQQHQHQRRREENPLRSDAMEDAKGLPGDVDVNQRPFVHFVDSDSGELRKEQHQELQEQKLPDDSVVYYSRQNDCLRDSREGISALRALLPANFPWAQEAFFFGDSRHNNNGQGNDNNNSAGGGGGNNIDDRNNIDAVNLWVGNSRAVSSMHKDHYENLMYVASGEKIFTLCPPADVVFLYEHLQYEQGVFEVLAGNGDSASPSWVVQRDSSAERQDEHGNTGGSGGSNSSSSSSSSSSSKVRWIAPDVSILLHGTARQRLELLRTYPLLRYAHPVEVRVRAGELLFLPKLWYHRVTQSCETVAINYWYEMAFDCSPLWCYYEFLQQLRHGEDDGDDVVVAELASDIPAIP